MKESKFQSDLIKKLKKMFVGCIVMKTDPNYIQGLPDILILYKDKWAALENKKSATASHQPNQDYYVELMNKMSFSRFIFPEIKEEVLNELQRAFKS
jgi:23S rRNA-/tRNA-specific pseudouridylate synthase